MAYLSQVHENLPIFGIAKQKNLQEFTTRDSDVARGLSRMPLILARLYEEDLKFTDGKKLKMSPSSLEKDQMSEADKMFEYLKDNIDYRNDAQRESIKRNSGRSS
jgi:hypothetical protein